MNVSVEGDTVTSPVSEDTIDKTTSETGSEVRFTWMVSVAPDSLTSLENPLAITVIPAVSSSVVVTFQFWSATPS